MILPAAALRMLLSPALPGRWLRLGIVVFSLLVIGGYGFEARRHVSQERENIVAVATDRAQDTVTGLEEHLQRTMQSIDFVLRSAVEKIEPALRGEKADLTGIDYVLWDLHAQAPSLRTLFFVDPAGQIAAASGVPEILGLDVSMREYFRAHVDRRSAETHYHAASVGQVTGPLLVPLTRRLDYPSGRFAGVIVAALEPEYLENFYTRMLGRKPVHLGVYSSDGVLLAHIPRRAGLAGQDMSDMPLFTRLLPAASSGVARLDADFFGPTRHIAYARAGILPFVLAATLPEDILLAGWTQQASGTVKQVVLISIAIAALAGFLVAMTYRWERAARDLSESQERFRDFAEAASDWSWEMDTDLRFSRVSDKFHQVFGTQDSDIIGRTREQMIDPQNLPAGWHEHLAKLASHRPFRDYICKTTLADGRTVHCKTSGKPIFAGDGCFAGYRGTGADITRQVEAEEHTRRQAALLQDAIEALPDGFVLYDAEDRFVACNAKFRELRAANPISFQPGARFEDILRAAIVLGEFQLSEGQTAEDWIRDRMRARRQNAGLRISRSHDRWLRVSERRTSDGGMVAIHADITELKTAQAEMEAARVRMTDWAEASNDWFWETDSEHRLSFMSDRNSPAGSGNTANLGKRVWDLATDVESEPEKWTKHGDALDRREAFRDLIFRVPGSGGANRVLSACGKPVFDADGNFGGYRGTARDVTDEVRAKKKAARAQRLLTEALEATEEGFAIWDAEDRLVLCNSPFRRLHGVLGDLYEPGMRFEDIVRGAVGRGAVPNAKGREEALIAERLAAHRQNKGVFESRLANGRWKRVKEYRLADGGMVGVHIDITDQKMREIELGELARRNALFFTAVSRATSAMVIADAKMAGQPIIYANPAFTALTGYGDDDTIGQNADFIYDAGEAPAAVETIRKAVEARQPVEIMVPARHQDGRRIYLDLRAGPVANRDGQVTHFVFVQDDVTKRVEAETQRSELENQLRQSQKIEALGTLAGGIAHDINNTLVPIVALSKMLLKTMPADNPRREPMQTILEASHRARDLVAQILAFSRKDMPKTDRVGLQETVGKAVRLLTASLAPNISIVQDLAVEPVDVGADENQLVQVLMNLCTNAAHAIGTNNGRVTITLDSVDINDKAGAHPSGLPHGPYARLRVTDTGCGMDARTLHRIFEPFFTTKGVGEGTGLGLSVVHGIIANHRGRITVDSEVGSGTTFTILLPVATDAGAATAEETAEPPQLIDA